jgi:hypothetical protein
MAEPAAPAPISRMITSFAMREVDGPGQSEVCIGRRQVALPARIAGVGLGQTVTDRERVAEGFQRLRQFALLPKQTIKSLSSDLFAEATRIPIEPESSEKPHLSKKCGLLLRCGKRGQ